MANIEAESQCVSARFAHSDSVPHLRLLFWTLAVITVSIAVGVSVATSFSSVKFNSPYGGCSTYAPTEPPAACAQLVPFLVLVAVLLMVIAAASFTLQLRHKPRRTSNRV